jgi:hypothetical protein
LFLRCKTDDGRHDFAVGPLAAGPIAFVHCRATNAHQFSGPVALDLSDRTETFTVGWVDPKTGKVKTAETPLRGGRVAELRPPADGPAVLWLARK